MEAAGVEPSRTCFSNSVTTCDFWSKGLIVRRLSRWFHSSPVLVSPLESTPVVERIRRAVIVRLLDGPPGSAWDQTDLGAVPETRSSMALTGPKVPVESALAAS